MAREKVTEKVSLTTCTKCGKTGEVVIGPYGKGLCSECIQKSNRNTEKHNKGFIDDLGQPKKIK